MLLSVTETSDKVDQNVEDVHVHHFIIFTSVFVCCTRTNRPYYGQLYRISRKMKVKVNGIMIYIALKFLERSKVESALKFGFVSLINHSSHDYGQLSWEKYSTNSVHHKILDAV